MRGVARQMIGRQGRLSADSDVTYCGMARRLSLLLSLPIGLRRRRDRTSELYFSSVAECI